MNCSWINLSVSFRELAQRLFCVSYAAAFILLPVDTSATVVEVFSDGVNQPAEELVQTLTLEHCDFSKEQTLNSRLSDALSKGASFEPIINEGLPTLIKMANCKVRARELGLQKIPAIVINGSHVCYGQYLVQECVTRYQEVTHGN